MSRYVFGPKLIYKPLQNIKSVHSTMRSFEDRMMDTKAAKKIKFADTPTDFPPVMKYVKEGEYEKMKLNGVFSKESMSINEIKSGTTAGGRKWLQVDVNPAYCAKHTQFLEKVVDVNYEGKRLSGFAKVWVASKDFDKFCAKYTEGMELTALIKCTGMSSYGDFATPTFNMHLIN